MGVEVTCHSAIFSIVTKNSLLLVRSEMRGPFVSTGNHQGVTPTHSEDLAFTALRAVAPLSPLSPVSMQQSGCMGPQIETLAINRSPLYWGVTCHGDIQTTSSNLHPIPIGSWLQRNFVCFRSTTDSYRRLNRSSASNEQHFCILNCVRLISQ